MSKEKTSNPMPRLLCVPVTRLVVKIQDNINRRREKKRGIKAGRFYGWSL